MHAKLCLILPVPRRLSIKRDRMHVLFGGTKLLQVRLNSTL